jgi:hypothetical protein
MSFVEVERAVNQMGRRELLATAAKALTLEERPSHLSYSEWAALKARVAARLERLR